MKKPRRRPLNYLKILRNVGILTGLLALAYVLGPKPEFPILSLELPKVPEAPQLVTYVAQKEASFPVKPGNEARIVWADTPGKVTDYAFVYLHGFTASAEEGEPLHRETAARYKANLYIARLPEHGVKSENPMENYTIVNQWEGASEALAIGLKLGKKVILMGTSTGGTLALMLAEHYKSKVHSLLLFSPNIRVNDPNAHLLNDHWGKQLATLVLGGNQYQVPNPNQSAQAFWHTRYSINALVELQEMLEEQMTPAHWIKIVQPTLILAYYKNEQEQDRVVRVDAMTDAFQGLSTPDKDKKMVKLATPGDHVIGSKHKSKDLDAVRKATFEFFDERLN